MLLDFGLPGLNGNEVAREMRKLAATQLSLLIAVTGYSHEQYSIKSREAGFDHYLVKPINVDALLDLIRSARVE